MSAFETLVRQILKTKNKVDDSLRQLKVRADEVDCYYEPRREFERWRDSTTGTSWKQQQYQTQKGCCANCKNAIEIKGSHIDHIKSLASYPKLAISTANLRILCPDCNLRKGSHHA